MELHIFALLLVIEARLASVLIVEHTEIFASQPPGAASSDLLLFPPEMTDRENSTRLFDDRKAYYDR